MQAAIWPGMAKRVKVLNDSTSVTARNGACADDANCLSPLLSHGQNKWLPPEIDITRNPIEIIGSGGRIRIYNQSVNSRLLYR